MLQGNIIAIRPVKQADLALLYDLVNDLNSAEKFLPNIWQPEPVFRGDFERTGFLSETLSRFVIVNSQNQLVGLTWSFKSIPYFDALEVGYRVFDAADRGKGYASEALRLLCKYLFESSQVNRIEVRVATEHVASQAVAKKCGFTLEGTHREAAYSKGTLYDMHSYALLRSEWATGS